LPEHHIISLGQGLEGRIVVLVMGGTVVVGMVVVVFIVVELGMVVVGIVVEGRVVVVNTVVDGTVVGPPPPQTLFMHLIPSGHSESQSHLSPI
jgi:hypothetical protein